MALQSYNIAVGNLTDDSQGNNYSVNAPVYITTENLVSVPIYKDLAGTIPIPQNGVDNTTDENGTFTFYVEAGQYLANVGGTNYIINVVGSDYFDSRIDETIAEINDQNKLVLDEYGKNFNLITVFDFATGGTIETSNQCVRYTDGNSYQWQGSLPKTVNPGDTPTSPDWLQVTFNEIDNISGLRDELDDRPKEVSLSDAISENAGIGTKYIIYGGRYDVVANSDTGGYYIATLANGNKLKLIPANGELRLSWIGQLESDATTQLQNLSSISDDLNVIFDYEVTMTLTDTVNFAKPKSIDFGKKTTVNCDVANTSTPITVGSNALTLIHTFTEEYPEFSSQFTSDSIAGLERGSMLSIWNPVDGSWNGFRNEYRQGEYVLVEETQDGNIVQTQGKTQDTYPTGTKVYLLDSSEINLTGRLFVTNTGDYGTMFGLRSFQLLNSNQDGLKVGLLNGTHAYSLVMSMNCHGKSVEFYQEADQVSGANYGISHNSNQNCTFYGDFHADRHASTIGSGGQDGAAINRDIYSFGRFTTSGLGGVQAADMHGNAERCGYGGYMEGLIIGGNDGYINKGSKIVSPANNKPSVQFAEMKGFNHKIEATIEAKGAPSSRGIIDLGGNSESANANTTDDGVLDFSGCKISGSSATQGAVRVRNRGSLANFSVDLSGVSTDVPNSTNDFVFLSVSGSEVSSVTFNNDAWKGGVAASAGINFVGISQKGEYTFTADTSTSNDTRQITFDSPFPSGYEPVITVSDDKAKVGTTRILSEGSNNDELSFFSLVFTIDDSNFSVADTITVRWIAEI